VRAGTGKSAPSTYNIWPSVTYLILWFAISRIDQRWEKPNDHCGSNFERIEAAARHSRSIREPINPPNVQAMVGGVHDLAQGAASNG
jgi:hypothetical protein